MRRRKDQTRCIAGLFFEVLIVGFIIFSSLSVATSELARGNNATLTATPLEPIAIREAEHAPKQLINNLPSVWLKFATSLVLSEDHASNKQVTVSNLSAGLCYFNIYYTRITAKAP